MTSTDQQLAHTTAALLQSSVPFLCLSALALPLALAALLLSQSLWVTAMAMVILLLALPIAWLAMRVILDWQVLRHWSRTAPAPAEFDQALIMIGLAAPVAARSLTERARGCLALLRRLLAAIAVQWLCLLMALLLLKLGQP